MAPLRALSIPLLTAAALVSGCNRGSAPGGADAGQATRSAAQPAAATPSASSPSLGTTNASTAAEGSDLSNSTAATGKSNVYQPASADNRTPGGAAAAPVAGNSATPIPGAAS